MKCPNCSEPLPAEALFCGGCGQSVAPPVLAPARVGPFIEPPQAVRQQSTSATPASGGDHSSCTACGAVMSFADLFCGACGHVAPAVSAAVSSARETNVIESIRARLPERPVDGADGARVRAPDARSGPAPSGAASERFVLQFSTGESVTVSGTGLVGRNPVPEPGEYFDRLVRLLDSTRSVSKTHLEFGQQAGLFWVSDRYSGNGTVVREPDRPAIRCEPGKREIVARGARVVIGEQFFVVS